MATWFFKQDFESFVRNFREVGMYRTFLTRKLNSSFLVFTIPFTWRNDDITVCNCYLIKGTCIQILKFSLVTADVSYGAGVYDPITGLTVHNKTKVAAVFLIFNCIWRISSISSSTSYEYVQFLCSDDKLLLTCSSSYCYHDHSYVLWQNPDFLFFIL